MYNNPQILGATVTPVGAVAALPLTSGNTILQAILIATAAVAFTILVVRILRIITQNRSLSK